MPGEVMQRDRGPVVKFSKVGQRVGQQLSAHAIGASLRLLSADKPSSSRNGMP